MAPPDALEMFSRADKAVHCGTPFTVRLIALPLGIDDYLVAFYR
jgi:hypothetical protein